MLFLQEPALRVIARRARSYQEAMPYGFCPF